MRKKTTAVLLTFFLLANYLPITSIYAEDKSRIAISDLKANGLNQSKAISLTNVLRDTISGFDLFRMLDKDERFVFIKSVSEKQAVAPDCTTDTCLAEIAQELGIEFLITGSINKIGRTHIVSLRLTDTKLKKTIKTIGVPCICKEDVLFLMVKKAGHKLFDIDESGEPNKIPQESSIKQSRSYSQERVIYSPKTKSTPKPTSYIKKKRTSASRAKSTYSAKSRLNGRTESSFLKNNKSILLWTVGILALGGVAAALAGGSSGGGGGGGGSDPPPQNQDTGDVEFSW